MCTANFFHVESIGEKTLFLSLLIVRGQIKTSENILPHGYGVRIQISLIYILVKTDDVAAEYERLRLRDLLLGIQVILPFSDVAFILLLILVENSERSTIS